MKFNALGLTLLIVFGAAFCAEAVTLQWTHDNPTNVDGYNLYYQPADQSEGPYKTTVTGGSTFQVDIPTENFKPGAEYDFWATAYNAAAESAPTAKIQWTRPEYTPDSDSGPDTIYIMPGSPDQLIINLGN